MAWLYEKDENKRVSLCPAQDKRKLVLRQGTV